MGDAIYVMLAQPGLWWWYGEPQPLAGRPAVYQPAVHILLSVCSFFHGVRLHTQVWVLSTCFYNMKNCNQGVDT